MRLHGRFGLGRAARDQPCHRLDVTALALALSGHRRARRFDCRAGLVEALLEKQAHAGTGVGQGELRVVRRGRAELIEGRGVPAEEAHGGGVKAEPAEGGGTRMTLWLNGRSSS